MSEKILVDKKALISLMSAVTGPDHYIREFQYTRGIGNNPIDIILGNIKTSKEDPSMMLQLLLNHIRDVVNELSAVDHDNQLLSTLNKALAGTHDSIDKEVDVASVDSKDTTTDSKISFSKMTDDIWANLTEDEKNEYLNLAINEIKFLINFIYHYTDKQTSIVLGVQQSGLNSNRFTYITSGKIQHVILILQRINYEVLKRDAERESK